MIDVLSQPSSLCVWSIAAIVALLMTPCGCPLISLCFFSVWGPQFLLLCFVPELSLAFSSIFFLFFNLKVPPTFLTRFLTCSCGFVLFLLSLLLLLLLHPSPSAILPSNFFLLCFDRFGYKPVKWKTLVKRVRLGPGPPYYSMAKEVIIQPCSAQRCDTAIVTWIIVFVSFQEKNSNDCRTHVSIESKETISDLIMKTEVDLRRIKGKKSKKKNIKPYSLQKWTQKRA